MKPNQLNIFDNQTEAAQLMLTTGVPNVLLSEDVDRKKMTFDRNSPYYYAFAPHFHESVNTSTVDLANFGTLGQQHQQEQEQEEEEEEHWSEDDDDAPPFEDDDDLGSSSSSIE